MVMQITVSQLKRVAAEEKDGMIVSTNSRNRKVEIHLKNGEFLIFDAGKLMGETHDPVHAVEVFNYYGMRELKQK